MANTIFFGDRVRALRAALQLNTAATIASGAVDPTSVAPGISLSVGSIYLSTSTGKIYSKHTSTGNDTNFYEVQTSNSIADLAADVADLISLSGVSANSTDLGSFTGTTIPNNSTVKGALQALETEVETKAADTDVADLITLSGVAANSTTLGTFTGTTIPDNSDVKEAIQALETEVETKLDASEKGASLGVATLDAGGKVPVSQLPNSLMDYLGTWAASTNTPTLANGTGSAGDVYVASDAGTVNFGAGNITFAAGDWVIYSGAIWEKSVNSNAVASVNGFTGVVVLDTNDIAEDTNLYFTEPRVLATDLLGFVSGSGNVTAADSILTAVQKLNGNTGVAFGDIDDLVTLSGAGANATNLGTFTGTTIPDNSTIKAALQSLETAVEVAPSTVFSDSVFRIQDNGDATKQLAFEASSIATGTTRTITMPDSNVNLGDIATTATDLSNHLTDTTDAHDASAISNVPSGNLAATDVQGALNELQTDINGRATTSLNNLASTAVNTDLLPDGPLTRSLGGTNAWVIARAGRFSPQNSEFFFSGDTTSGSFVVTNIADTTNINTFQAIFMVGVPSGSFVSSKTVSTVTFSNPENLPATATATGVPFTTTYAMFMRTDDKGTTGVTGHTLIRTGNTVDGVSGDTVIRTGAASGVGNSGDVKLMPGSVASGIQGRSILTGRYTRLPNRASDPSDFSAGGIYWNTTSNKFRQSDGTSWADISGTASSEFSDALFRIQDNGDATKEVAFEASAITTATTRTITVPDADVDLGDIAANATDIADLITLSGVAANSTDLGTFTGTTIPDNSDIKQALQSLETAVEASGGGATTELDNLTTTAINADLLPDTTSTYTLGSTSLKWNEIYANNGRFVNDVLVTAPDVVSTPQVSLVDSDLKHLNMTLQSSTESGLIDLSGSGTLDIQSSIGNIKLTPGSGLIDVSSAKITQLADPTNPQDAATKLYVDSSTSESTDDQTLVASDTISTSITHTHQVIIVAGNAAGTVVLSATPFGTGTAKDGQLITLIGNSATNLIQIDNNNAAKGCIMNASWVGGLYDSITFAYSSIQDRYVEISRNN